MTRSRKILIGTVAGCALVLLALAFVLPLIARGPVARGVRTAVNESVDAQVDLSAVGITFSLGSPDVAVPPDGLSVIGAGPFDRATLAAIGRFRLVYSLPSLLRAA